VTIGGLCFGLFHLTSWLLGKTNWLADEIPQSELVSYILACSIATAFITLWVARFEKPDLTKFPPRQLEAISGRTFMAETIEIDGKVFEHCTFKNTTFLYRGTDTFSFNQDNFEPPIFLRTDNKAIHDFESMRIALDKMLKGQVKIFDLDRQNNPHPLN
jgi:hypothetical protein